MRGVFVSVFIEKTFLNLEYGKFILVQKFQTSQWRQCAWQGFYPAHESSAYGVPAFQRTMVERHYADCTLINAYVPKWPARMIDVGSGAGFPGIPLKIVNPSIRLTLCEPRPNRINFLNMVIEKMGLKGIDVFGHKVTSRSMTIPVDGVISRAFELMEKTLPRIANSLKVGGRVFFMKGPAVADELKTFYPEDFGYKFVGKHFYTIPNSTQDRALIILERVE